MIRSTGSGQAIRTEPMTVNIGPQHPSTHGVFRLRVTFDGEEILQVEPIFGYLHRGTEKLAEERNYTQVVTLTDRLDYVSSMINNQAYCLAVEKLLGAEVPKRGKYLRTLAAELQRIASHLMGIGFIIQDLGALGTPLMYCFRSRERILDLFENGSPAGLLARDHQRDHQRPVGVVTLHHLYFPEVHGQRPVRDELDVVHAK